MCYISILMARQPLSGQRRLLVEASRSHSDTPHSVGLLWTSDRFVVETSTWQHNTHSRETFMLSRDSNPQSQQASGCRRTR